MLVVVTNGVRVTYDAPVVTKHRAGAVLAVESTVAVVVVKVDLGQAVESEMVLEQGIVVVVVAEEEVVDGVAVEARRHRSPWAKALFDSMTPEAAMMLEYVAFWVENCTNS